MTIDQAVENGQPSVEFNPGETAIGLNIPGHAMVVRLDGMSGPTSLFLLAPGKCPTRPLRNMQWIVMHRADPAAPVAGTLDFNPRTRKITIAHAYSIDGAAARGFPMTETGSFVCTNGVASGPGTRIRFMQDESAVIERAGADQIGRAHV